MSGLLTNQNQLKAKAKKEKEKKNSQLEENKEVGSGELGHESLWAAISLIGALLCTYVCLPL